MNAITGAMAAVVLAPLALGQDANFFRWCGQQVADGQTYVSLYPPLTGFAALPLVALSPAMTAVVMSATGVVLLLLGIRHETRRLSMPDRVMVGIAAFAFAPVVYELILGQVTILILASLYPVVRRDDRLRNGLAFGVALALAPKPMLMLVLVWMLVWRRRALVGAFAIAAALTAIGLLLAGPQAYVDWARSLADGGSAAGQGIAALGLHGNLSLWPMTPPKAVLAVVIVLAALWAILRDQDRGVVVAVVAGLLVAPYTGLYAVSLVLLVVQPALRVAPLATRLLALVANLCLLFLSALVLWGLAAIAVVLPRPMRVPRVMRVAP
jgi:hypothetical protein